MEEDILIRKDIPTGHVLGLAYNGRMREIIMGDEDVTCTADMGEQVEWMPKPILGCSEAKANVGI